MQQNGMQPLHDALRIAPPERRAASVQCAAYSVLQTARQVRALGMLPLLRGVLYFSLDEPPRRSRQPSASASANANANAVQPAPTSLEARGRPPCSAVGPGARTRVVPAQMWQLRRNVHANPPQMWPVLGPTWPSLGADVAGLGPDVGAWSRRLIPTVALVWS
jgi:hypothetical protein